MLSVFNIGNTNTQYSLYDENSKEFQEIKTVPTSSLSPAMIPDDIPVAVSTVVPKMKEVLKDKNIFWMGPAVCKGLDLSRIDRNTIGADRLANAMALLYFSGKLPAVCIDCGTAITFEVVNENKVFLGGAIVPGRMLMRRALNLFTAQLPLTELRDYPPDGPALNTADSIALGVDRGVLGSIKEILGTIRKSIGAPDCTVIAVGGDAPFFTKNIPGIYLGAVDYTLRGIAKAWELENK